MAGILLLLFIVVSTATLETATSGSATATRTLPAEPVSAGEFFPVRIEASGYGMCGQVIETLPEGFTYMASTLDSDSVEVVGNAVKFYLLGETSFNYTVAASHTEGTYNFSGILKDEDLNESEVGGDKEIVVESATAIATRTLLAEPVSTSANFTIEIEASGYGTFCQVIETLPEGFVYVKSTLDPGSVVVEMATNTVKFTLFGETSFNYTVTASNTEGTYYFNGILKDEDLKEYEVGGDKEIAIESPAATRTLPAEPVSTSANFTIGIETSGYGAFCQVVETLPAGFCYMTSTLDPGSVEVVDNTAKFTLLGEASFNYTLTALDIEGTYTFSGILIDVNEREYEVGGDAKLVVEEKEETTATRTLPAEPVSPSANFTIGIEASGYGTFGQVIETLPIGFKYVTSTLDPGSIEVEDSTVKFTLFGETSFSYTVTASDTQGTYYFSGILKDADLNEYEVGGDKGIAIGPLGLFDTCSSANPYPSIFGTHNGTIELNQDITVHSLYTYPCLGTGGHSEYIKIWNATGWNVSASWEGYVGDWHNISFDASFTLKAGEPYNYTIRTGSYPQIIHTKEFNATGGKITCSEFTDANGKRYEEWIPAIRLE